MRVLSIHCIALAWTLFPFALPAQSENSGVNQNRTISVEGDAEIKVAPDRILLTLGIEVSDKDLARAKELHDTRTRAVLEAVKNTGIEAKDIQTDYLEIEPRYEWSSRPENFIGYFVRKTLVVTIRDVPRFEGVLSVALSSGANYVLGVQFLTSELRKHRDEARALAIKAAREKAVDLASQLNQKVGVPVNISETSSRWYSWYGRGWWGGRQSYQAQNVVQNIGGDSISGDSVISPGRISVSASVRVTFELQ